MKNNNKDVLLKNVKQLLEDKTSAAVYSEAFRNLKPTKTRVLFLVMSLLFTGYFAYYTASGSETILRVKFLLKLSNDTFIPLFGIVFTGYALFQALAGEGLVVRLLSNDQKQQSYFRSYNMFFLAVSALFLLLITFNCISLAILEGYNPKYFPLNGFYNILETILLSLYLLYNLNLILEIKSLIYNLYQCFSLNAFCKAVEFIKRENGD